MKPIRLAIRFKVLLTISAVLSLAFGTYLYLATSLFTQDKLAYVHDLNRALASSVARQTGSHLDLLHRELTGLAHEPTDDAFSRLLSVEPELLRLRLPSATFVNRALMEDLGLGGDDLELIDELSAGQRHKASASGRSVALYNSSIEPDIALLSLVIRLPDGGQAVADLRHQRLIGVFDRSELHETFLIDEAGQVVAHPRAALVLNRQVLPDHELTPLALQSQFRQGAATFSRHGIEYIGAFARVSLPANDHSAVNNATDLWVITQTPRAEALRASSELVNRSALLAVAIFLAAFIVSIIFSRYITAAIQELRDATAAMGKGDFEVRFRRRSNDEIGDLALAFAHMAQAIKHTQAQLVQSEKMAVFGQLGAGITHEVKNPMTGIIGFAQLAQRKLDNPEKAKELLGLIEREGVRCRKILDNFLKFADASEERLRVNINDLINEAANVVNHQLAVNGVKLHVEKLDHPLYLMANPGEMQQVLMNLAINAQQAMHPEGGDVFFSVEDRSESETRLILRVRDNGPGIPAHIIGRIFEPFFSTKARGQGTGLGLSVSFGIVSGHHGTLTVDSTEGEGTEFVISLPTCGTAEEPLTSGALVAS